MTPVLWVIVFLFVGSFILSGISKLNRKYDREHFINEKGIIVNADDKSLTYNQHRRELKKVKNHYVVKEGYNGVLIIETDDKVIPEIRIVVYNGDFGVRGAGYLEDRFKQAIEWSKSNTPKYKIDDYLKKRYG